MPPLSSKFMHEALFTFRSELLNKMFPDFNTGIKCTSSKDSSGDATAEELTAALNAIRESIISTFQSLNNTSCIKNVEEVLDGVPTKNGIVEGKHDEKCDNYKTCKNDFNGDFDGHLLSTVSVFAQEWEQNRFIPFFNWTLENKCPTVKLKEACLNPVLFNYLISNNKLHVDWAYLSRNSNLTMDVVLKYPRALWSIEDVCCNPGITVQDMLNHRDYCWDCRIVSKNPNLNIKIINEFPRHDWNWKSISCNPGITMQDIINHPKYPWDWEFISDNPNFELKIVAKYPDMKYDWYRISRHPGISLQDISIHPEYPWDWYNVSNNPNLNINFISHNLDKKWDWCCLSACPAITMEDVIKHPEYPRNFEFGIPKNPNFNIDMLHLYPRLCEFRSYYWTTVSINPGIHMKDIMNHPEYSWNWESVCQNPNLNLEIVTHQKFKHNFILNEVRWDGIKCPEIWWKMISRNPGILITDIIQHPELPWWWEEILNNSNAFPLDKELYVNNQMGRLLLVSILDDYNNDTSTPLNETLLVLYSDYHLSNIVKYV